MNGSPNALNWLLDRSDAAVRAQALVSLCGADPSSAEVAEARRLAMESGPIAEILSHQLDHGGWESDGDYHARGTMACMPQLAQLGADPADERIRHACERLLSLIPDDGFLGTGCGQPNVLWALARFGCVDDSRFRRACEAHREGYRLEDGTRAGRLRWQRGMCFGKHPCFMAIVPTILLCIELRDDPAFPWAESLLAESVEFLLKHQVYLSTRTGRPIRTDWVRFAFPSLACDTDALDLLAAVCAAGHADDPRVIPAVELALSKHGPDGLWPLDHSYSPSDGGSTMRAKRVGNFLVSMWADFGRRGEPSKWITLKALSALRSVPSSFADADPPPLVDSPRTLSPRRPALRRETEQRRREFLLSIGAEAFIDVMLEVGEALCLQPTFDHHLFLGPEWLPEWVACRAVIVGGTWKRAHETKSGWLWRVMFMARQSAFTEENVLSTLDIPREPPKGKKKRIRFGRWERDYEEVSIDLYSLEECQRLETLLTSALATLDP